jgi:hypothetical protein
MLGGRVGLQDCLFGGRYASDISLIIENPEKEKASNA